MCNESANGFAHFFPLPLSILMPQRHSLKVIQLLLQNLGMILSLMVYL